MAKGSRFVLRGSQGQGFNALGLWGLAALGFGCRPDGLRVMYSDTP